MHEEYLIWQDRLEKYLEGSEEYKKDVLKKEHMSEKAYLAYVQRGIERQEIMLNEIRNYFKRKYMLPDVEQVAALVHKAWMDGKLAKGITSRKAEDGEELMVDYFQLSESQKEQDRATVRTVYEAIKQLSNEI